MPSKLTIFNDTLKILGDHRLVTETDEVEARYELDRSWTNAVAFVFQAAFWRFTLVTATLTHNGTLTPTVAGYTSVFAQPANYYRPHALFVLSSARECPLDVKQQGVLFYANTTPINIRYVSSALVATPASWPETVAKAVAAYMAFDIANRISQDPQATKDTFELWEQYFAAAQAVEAVPPDPWLDHQLSGRLLKVVRSMLEDGNWRFAVVTAELTANASTPSSGYLYSFDRPAAWIKTFSVYRTGFDQDEIDFREENEDFHANYTPITVRYVSSTLGTDGRNWPGKFEDALLAELALRQALETPGTPGAVIQGLLAVAKDKKNDARSSDDGRETPPIDRTSRFVEGRFSYGRFGRTSREQGW